jgi:hypothetical protein
LLVLGVGAVVLLIVDVGELYHNKFVPVADNCNDAAFLQYCIVVVAVGGGGTFGVTAIFLIPAFKRQLVFKSLTIKL